MKIYHTVFISACTFLILFLEQSCPAQCFINVTRNCGAEQYSNACSQACNAGNIGQFCGFSVTGDSFLSYSTFRPALEGYSVITHIPLPRYCGVITSCVCTGNDLGLPPACLKLENFVDDYTVAESYVTVECDDDPEVGGPPS